MVPIFVFHGISVVNLYNIPLGNFFLPLSPKGGLGLYKAKDYSVNSDTKKYFLPCFCASVANTLKMEITKIILLCKKQNE
jgi:hypothetical protein